MDSLDWGVEAVTVPKSMISTGLNPSRESEERTKDAIIETASKSVAPVSATASAEPREPKTLSEKYGLQAMLARLGDASVEKSSKQLALEKTALKKVKKCAPV